MNALSIFFISITSMLYLLKTSSLMYCRSLASNNWYSASDADPRDIWRNLASSVLVFLPHPSAMFVGIDAAERLS